VSALFPKEEKVIRLRCGIGCEREHTLEEIRLGRIGSAQCNPSGKSSECDGEAPERSGPE
jgi:hypothetical protein